MGIALRSQTKHIIEYNWNDFIKGYDDVQIALLILYNWCNTISQPEDEHDVDDIEISAPEEIGELIKEIEERGFDAVIEEFDNKELDEKEISEEFKKKFLDFLKSILEDSKNTGDVIYLSLFR